MGTITVNVKDSIEHGFRKAVKTELGTGKGILGKAITEAMQKWVDDVEQKKIAESEISVLKKGYSMGGLKYSARGELHER